MNTTLRYLGLNARTSWERFIDEKVRRFEKLIKMTAATVTLERRREIKPAFRVQMLLEVSGPVLHADATDFTLRAALLKASKSLERQIHSRRSKWVVRRKGKLQLRTFSSRWSGAVAG